MPVTRNLRIIALGVTPVALGVATGTLVARRSIAAATASGVSDGLGPAIVAGLGFLVSAGIGLVVALVLLIRYGKE